MKTTIINIYGAPGAGKSTLAAEIYAELNKRGESVELVREVAKEYAWTGRLPSTFEQIYITTEQMLKETALYGKVKYVVTDSPIELGDFYNQYYHNNLALSNEWLIEVSKASYPYMEALIGLFVPIEPKLFQNNGRFSNLEESLHIEKQLKKYLDNQWLQYKELNNRETRLQDALKEINAG